MMIFLSILMLVLANFFMTFAWYGHLKFESLSWYRLIAMSWGIAFFEYLLQVPANRMAFKFLTPYQLKVIQECITLLVFVVFAKVYFGEPMTWRYGLAFGLIFMAVLVVFYPST